MLKLAVLPFLFVAMNPPQAAKAPAERTGGKPIEFKKSVLPIVKKSCLGCHAGPYPADRIDLSKFKTQADVNKDVRLWRKVGHQVAEGHMPPSGSPKLSAKDRKTIVDYCSQLRRPS